MDWTLIIIAVLNAMGVSLSAWLSHRNGQKIDTVVHQTNSMQEEMQRLSKAEGKAEEKAEASTRNR